MQVVRFTYDSTEVEISAFLVLFFRLSGIYVSERHLNLEPAVCSKMLDALPDGKCDTVSKVYDQYEMELYIVRSEEEFKAFQRYGYTAQTILIVLGDKWIRICDKEFDQGKTVNGKSGCSIEMLKELLQCIYSNNLISYKSFESLCVVADIFCRDHAAKLLLCSKYFYTAENSEQYNNIISHYQKVTDDLFAALGKMSPQWGDVSYIHLEYAALYAAYEGDLYCIRHNKPFLYTAESIVGVCRTLLMNKDVVLALGDSIHLLAAQVYSDLLKSINNAYDHYTTAYREYSAFACYKMAVNLINISPNYQLAVQYLSKSLRIYPAYYHAWYMLGICYMYLEQWQKAISAFDNLEIILLPRLRNHLLRPMEIDYLFREANQSGDILLQKMKQVTPAADRYLFAEKVWKSIDEIPFHSFIDGDFLTTELIRNRIKKELDIDRLNNRLSEIYGISQMREKSLSYAKMNILGGTNAKESQTKKAYI